MRRRRPSHQSGTTCEAPQPAHGTTTATTKGTTWVVPHQRQKECPSEGNHHAHELQSRRTGSRHCAARKVTSRPKRPNDFWRRWSRDYIGTLQERTKWRSARGPSLAVGTVVLVREERLPPCRWRLGKIVATQPGRDGITRVAIIRTARGDIQRAFNNICPLPTSGQVI
ncbi:uncharacterized protein LOC134661082 isoform X3 [Cydia amplana]|uniref:uncharacterized protein LOC134661082 isoform X3 n=1 Tax=Cydia amplana TaxID=1869771 RepID=UPI002FE662B6